jgi:hypothetical protein
MASQHAMYTGLVGTLKIEPLKGRIMAGVSFWPVGWLLTLGEDSVVPGALDVSDWLELDRDRNGGVVDIPCQWSFIHPGDFRSPDQIAREVASDSALR